MEVPQNALPTTEQAETTELGVDQHIDLGVIVGITIAALVVASFFVFCFFKRDRARELCLLTLLPCLWLLNCCLRFRATNGKHL